MPIAADLARYSVWCRLIDADTRTRDHEKAALKIKAWAHFVSRKNFFSLMLDLPKVY